MAGRDYILSAQGSSPPSVADDDHELEQRSIKRIRLCSPEDEEAPKDTEQSFARRFGPASVALPPTPQSLTSASSPCTIQTPHSSQPEAIQTSSPIGPQLTPCTRSEVSTKLQAQDERAIDARVRNAEQTYAHDGSKNAGDGPNSSADELVCFGMLTELVVECVIDTSHTPLISLPTIIQNDKIVSRLDPSVHVGSIEPRIAEILQQLEEQGLSIQSYFPCRKPPVKGSSTSKLKSKRKRKRSTIQEELFVVLYGDRKQFYAVGDYLQDCELYLQDPLNSDRNVPYLNPHTIWAYESHPSRRMTMEGAVGYKPDLEEFTSTFDILKDVEYEDYLPETPTPSSLETALFSHQRQALTFMLRREQGWALQGPQPDIWRLDMCSEPQPSYVNTISENCTSRPPDDFRGGILADMMGLGKSLSIIALIASDKDNNCIYRPLYTNAEHVNTTLIVVRAPLLQTWEDQFSLHLQPNKLRYKRHYLHQRLQKVSQLENVDIVVTTYNTLVSEFKKHAAEPQLIYSVHWRRVVLDEAHDIRESYRIRARAACALEATNRWALTGTPIQNGLSDLASLYKFIRAFPYTDTRRFTMDITQLCRNTDGNDAIEKLKKLVRCITLRRSIAIVDLPLKSDRICKLNFSSEESALYERARLALKKLLDDATDPSRGSVSQVNVLPWVNSLRMICNLGTRAKIPQSAPTDRVWDKNAAQDTFNSLIVAGTAICSNCQTDLGTVATEVADEVSKVPCQSYLCACLHLICGPCVEKGSGDLTICGHDEVHPPMAVSTLSSTLPINEDVCTDTATLPTKVSALLLDLNQYYRTEKCVVFSYWTSTLDIIEGELNRNAIQSVRFDGNTRNKARVKVIQDFHQIDSVRVALMSLSCGSVGLDLTSASRAYLMEPHWNPSVEQQALARVYRMGQRKPVTTVRYIMRNSFEDHVIKIQRRKHELSELLTATEQSTSLGSNLERLKHLRGLIET